MQPSSNLTNKPSSWLLSQSNEHLVQSSTSVSSQQLFSSDSHVNEAQLNSDVDVIDEINNLPGAETTQLKIGIVTMPVLPEKQHLFPAKEYILDINRHFIQLSGATAVPIRYNIEEEQLYEMLDELDGVYFTGGFLNLFEVKNGITVEHPYYKTAKRIFQYSLEAKKVDGFGLPLLGICQGFQILHFLANDFAEQLGTSIKQTCIDTNHSYQSGTNSSPEELLNEQIERRIRLRETILSQVYMFNQNRRTEWSMHKEDTDIFTELPERVFNAMRTQDLTFHAHYWTVALETFKSNHALNNFFHIISYDDGDMSSTDESLRTKFVTSIRAKDFPMYATMYHPEYQMLTFVDSQGNQLSKDVWNLAKGPETDLIAKSISNGFAKQCLKRKNLKLVALRTTESKKNTEVADLTALVKASSTSLGNSYPTSISESAKLLTPYPLIHKGMDCFIMANGF